MVGRKAPGGPRGRDHAESPPGLRSPGMPGHRGVDPVVDVGHLGHTEAGVDQLEGLAPPTIAPVWEAAARRPAGVVPPRNTMICLPPDRASLHRVSQMPPSGICSRYSMSRPTSSLAIR